jgi:tricorn protease
VFAAPFIATTLAAFAAGDPILRSPDIHGDKVVFTSEGDLWLGDTKTNSARRLTRDSGVEEMAKFSPDGTQIAFSAVYDGIQELYVMPTAGGMPKRITYRWDYARCVGWSPDGKYIFFKGRSVPRSFGLYRVPASGGVEERQPIEFMAEADAVNDDTVVFTRFYRDDDAWFRYEGGMQNQVWLGDLSAKSFKPLTKVPGTNEFPVVSDGQVYFVNEHDRSFEIMSVPLTGGEPKHVYGPSNIELRELATGPGTLIFESGVDVVSVDTKTLDATKHSFSLESDLLHERPFRLKMAAGDSASISPNAKRVLIETRGQIVSLPVGEGEAKVWKTRPGARLQYPHMSPDAKKIAYVSDQTGEMQVWVADADGSNETQLTSDSRRQIKSLSWSPDSAWIAFNDSEMRTRIVNASTKEVKEVARDNGNWGGPAYDFSPDSKWMAYAVADPISGIGHIGLYEIATGETKWESNGFTDDRTPAFSQDGKYLAFMSRRNFNTAWDLVINQINTSDPNVACFYRLRNDVPDPFAPKDSVEGAPAEEKKESVPFRIDFDGLADRMQIVPQPFAGLTGVNFAGSRVLLVGGGQIGFYDLATKRGGTVTAGGSVQVTPNGQNLLVDNRVLPATAENAPPTQGAVSSANMSLDVDPRQEWSQIYWDAWRLLRDYFYVANMHGLDWQAIGDKYAVYLPRVRSRDELDILIRWLQAELGSSHQYLTAPAPRETPKALSAAFLGIDVEADQGKVRIKRILRGDGVLPSERSPLADPGLGVKEGDYILAIGGQEVSADRGYMDMLVGRAGQTVSLKVASTASGTGVRTVLVKPVANELRMRRVQWQADNRAYVNKISNGQIGYVHMWAMVIEDMNDFVRQFYPQRNKKALIIDTRFNNGGSTQSVMNKILGETLTGAFNMRSSQYGFTRQGEYFPGPMACVVNEFNVSCGEEFPDRFRDLKRGPIIGRRTYGGEVGSSPGWPLMDGGVISVPNYGMYNRDRQWAIEGAGVIPDIDVESDPNAYAAGRDPQLDKSVEWLLDEIKRNPKSFPLPPADPVKVLPGRQGG